MGISSAIIRRILLCSFCMNDPVRDPKKKEALKGEKEQKIRLTSIGADDKVNKRKQRKCFKTEKLKQIKHK